MDKTGTAAEIPANQIALESVRKIPAAVLVEHPALGNSAALSSRGKARLKRANDEYHTARLVLGGAHAAPSHNAPDANAARPASTPASF